MTTQRTPTAWYSPANAGQNDLLLPTPNAGELLIPPFGANGIELNNESTAMFAMNTAYDTVVMIPVNKDGSAGAGVNFVAGTRSSPKRGDFNGVRRDGSVDGILIPASLAFTPDRKSLYVTNLALYLPFAGVPGIAVDSAWTLAVKSYNVVSLKVDGAGCGEH
jgi:DNA-binding beta-propeller fold protein YncE